MRNLGKSKEPVPSTEAEPGLPAEGRRFRRHYWPPRWVSIGGDIGEMFGLLALIGVIWIAVGTEIPAKAVRAAEAWLDRVAEGPAHG